jgi:GMP synthase-like glutamine amidotransferase
VLAANDECPLEVLQRQQRLLCGTPFHPEQHDNRHRAGRTSLRNFYKLAGLPTP